MRKQPHHAIEKRADNKHWQNQQGLEDHQELGETGEFEDYEPPRLATKGDRSTEGHQPRHNPH